MRDGPHHLIDENINIKKHLVHCWRQHTVEHQIINNIKFAWGRTNSWNFNVAKRDGRDSPLFSATKIMIDWVVLEKNASKGRDYEIFLVFIINREVQGVK